METRVVNLGALEVCDVYVGRVTSAHLVPEGTPGRDGRFGNPVTIHEPCPICSRTHTFPGDTLPCFRSYFDHRIQIDSAFRREVETLRGKRLGCWCDGPCHGDTYVNYLEPTPSEDEAVQSIADLLTLNPLPPEEPF